MTDGATHRTGEEHDISDTMHEPVSGDPGASVAPNKDASGHSTQAMASLDIVGDTTTDDAVSIDHSSCCPECCSRFDCHASCLGHASPNPSINGGETFNDSSSGIFDEKFETSLKVVNEALLTHWRSKDSKLTKLKDVFVEGWRHGTSSANQTPAPKEVMQQTLHSPTSNKKSSPLGKQPRQSIFRNPTNGRVDGAKVAVQKVICTEEKTLDKSKPASAGSAPLLRIVEPPSAKEANSLIEGGRIKPSDKAKSLVHVEANGSRRIVNRKPAVPTVDLPGDTRSDSVTAETLTSPTVRTVCTDLLKKIVSQAPIRLKYIDKNRAMFGYALVTGKRVQEMVVVVFDTAAILSSITFEYKRTGKVVLPHEISPMDLVGNCIRSALYLMVAACVYALVVRILKVVLAVLRIVLLPVTLCAWVVG